MPLSEFQLIARFFAAADIARDGEGVVLGIGDDAAILRPPAGEDLLVSIDTLVDGVHFPHDMAPRDIGHRALAVNLSDLAAMGACPLWFTLALTLPAADEAWLDGFCAGMGALARAAGIVLVGGDTTHGPLSITVQVHGAAPRGAALRRDGARPGDEVWVSGWPGLAALGLRAAQGQSPAHPAALGAFLAPVPRLALGEGLRGLASAAIDVSDGLLADAGHIAERSGVHLALDPDALPVAPALLESLGVAQARALCLGGGDDYELCFTAPADRAAAITRLAERLAVRCTRIGRVQAGAGVSCGDVRPARRGYQHFGEGSE
jgi:thiamine-monophosphate kinase